MEIIEYSHEIERIKPLLSEDKSVWFSVWVDNDKHPRNTSLSFFYVLCGESEFILIVNHTDGINLSVSTIVSLLESSKEPWVFQKKKLLQSIEIKKDNLLDIDSYYFLKENKTIDYRTLFESLVLKYRQRGYYDNLFQSIPILKIVECIKTIVHTIQPTDNLVGFSWYNNEYIPILSDIERIGLRVDRKKFIDRWPNHQKSLLLDTVFTEYNPYTITSRPSNRHGGINFSALNKKDGTREVFIPNSNKIFLQMDYDAYHPRIIGKLINHELPKTSVHQWLADQYGCDYNEGKGITFQLLYGGIPKEFLEIPFFKKVDEFIQVFWEKTKTSKFIQTTKRRIPLEYVEDPNGQKVFNYLLQSMETEFNLEVLKKLKKEELPLPILYTYDSFLWQFNENDLETVKNIKRVVESFGFPIKASWGTDYSKV